MMLAAEMCSVWPSYCVSPGRLPPIITSTPWLPRMRCRRPTSASRGTLSRISVSSVSRLAIISGSVAFLAPEIGIDAVELACRRRCECDPCPCSCLPSSRCPAIVYGPAAAAGKVPTSRNVTTAALARCACPRQFRRNRGSRWTARRRPAPRSATRPCACALRRLRLSRSAADSRRLRRSLLLVLGRSVTAHAPAKVAPPAPLWQGSPRSGAYLRRRNVRANTATMLP